VQNVTLAAIAALAVELLPAVAFGLAAERVTRAVQRWPVAARGCSAAKRIRHSHHRGLRIS